MDKLRQVLEFIYKQLGELTPTHKILMGSGVVIILMTMFIVTQYSGKSDMVHLKVDMDNRTEALSVLQSQNIKYKTSESGILVPESRYMAAMQALTENNALGSDVSSTLLELLKAQPWYANREQNRAIRDAAMAQVLSQIISGWTYIQNAEVILSSPTQLPGRNRAGDKPTASVAVLPRQGELTQEQVQALAAFVAGTMANLQPENVVVTNTRTGHIERIRSSNEMMSSGSNFEERAKQETYFEGKIYDRLRYISNVIVSVNVQVDTKQEIVHDLEYKPENKGTENLLQETTTKTSQQNNASNGGESGVMPNTGASITGSGSSPANTNTLKETSDTFDSHVGVTETQTTKSQGTPLKINASVGIPRSYLEQIWKAKNPDAADPPQDTDLDTLFNEEKLRIEEDVMPLIDTNALQAVNSSGFSAGTSISSGTVTVSMHYDAMPANYGTGTGTVTADSLTIPGLSGSSFIGVSIKSIGAGALALVSLFLMFRLVRGTQFRRDLPSAAELVGLPPSLQTDEGDMIGEADESEPPMDALELDDDEIRSQKLLEQVDDLVSNNPAEASRLLLKWVNG